MLFDVKVKQSSPCTLMKSMKVSLKKNQKSIYNVTMAISREKYGG